MNNIKKLEKLGFFQCYENNTDIDPNNIIARVTEVNRSTYIIHTGEKEIIAELTGKLMFSGSENFPVTGDFVEGLLFDNDSHAIINKIYPRKTVLSRKASGKNIEIQYIAANINTAFIIQSLNEDFNVNRLTRYLIMVNNSKIEPVVLLSKADLTDKPEIVIKINAIKTNYPELKIIPYSSKTNEGINEIISCFIPNKTYCLLGSSGVGKTTLINILTGNSLATKKIRESDSKGRHTTSKRQIFFLHNGSLIVDTPGMRELGNFGINNGIEKTFIDIFELSKTCKFSDCTHINEPGCAILKALNENIINKEHYNNFIKILKEASFYDMSKIEKRQKDKEFGKMVKQIMKEKKSRKG